MLCCFIHPWTHELWTCLNIYLNYLMCSLSFNFLRIFILHVLILSYKSVFFMYFILKYFMFLFIHDPLYLHFPCQDDPLAQSSWSLYTPLRFRPPGIDYCPSVSWWSRPPVVRQMTQFTGHYGSVQLSTIHIYKSFLCFFFLRKAIGTAFSTIHDKMSKCSLFCIHFWWLDVHVARQQITGWMYGR